MDERTRLTDLIRTVSFQHSDEPVFKLVSGAMSRFYFNMKKTTMSPEGLFLVGKLVWEKMRELDSPVDALGGLTLGADPIAYAVSRYSYDMGAPVRAFVIRKEPKAHGLKLPVEGDVRRGDRVVILDDVITTGGSTIKAIEVARDFGMVIVGVIVLVDRCEQNGRQNIEALGYPVYPIFTVTDFL